MKQAAKNWYEALTSLLLKKGIKRSCHDYCIFVRKEEDGTFSYVLIWGDDIVVAQTTEEWWRPKLVLVHILQSYDNITLDQKKYIETVLRQFNISDCKAAATPGEVNLKLVNTNEEQKLVDPKLYRSLVGSKKPFVKLFVSFINKIT